MKYLAVFLVCLCATPAGATLLLYEGFEPVNPDPATTLNYRPGELLAPTNDTTVTANPGQHNSAYNVDWRYAGAGSATTNKAPGIANGSLVAPTGLQASVGNSVAFDTGQIGSARIGYTSQNAGTVYWSGLLKVTSVGSLSNGVNGMMLGGLNNAQGAGTLPTVVGAVLRIRADAAIPTTSYFIGTGMNSGTGSGTGGANVQFETGTSYHAEGDTVFVVASYTFVSGATNDIAKMWINPDPSTFGAGSEPSATLTSAPGSAIADSSASVNSFNLRNVNTVGAPGVLFDELRVGTTWADVTPLAVVVPELGAFWLLAACCGLVAVRKWVIKPFVST